jgi:hypothetical protein
MDDFAHLLLGYLIYKSMKLSGAKVGRLELAAALFGAVVPDLVWTAGLADYGAAHTATWYLLIALAFAGFGQATLAALAFGFSTTLHILVDAVMHVGVWMPFAPFDFLAIRGSFNYWETPVSIAVYWAVLLLLTAILLFAEKKKTGKLTAV